MDNPTSQPNTQTTLIDPSKLILAALRLKGQDAVVTDARTVLTEIEGPALIFRDTIVIGEASILGWIDRRYPWPNLFPSELDLYAKASTIAHALEQNPSFSAGLWNVLTHPTHLHRFLLGNAPTIADIALWTALQKTDSYAADCFEPQLFPNDEFAFAYD